MATRRAGLGKNLDVLLSNTSVIKPNYRKAEENKLSNLSIELLQRGQYQPRRVMDEASLEELAESIKRQGIIQPIVVRAIGEDNYEIIAGERRWRAAQLAGLTKVPVIIKNVSDKTAIALALIENIQREDLNPIEEAMAFLRLTEEFQLTHQQVAEAVGKSRATVSNLLRLIQLSEEVKQLLERGLLEMGHARALLTLSSSEQSRAAKIIILKKLSVRETEQLVKQIQNKTLGKKGGKITDPNITKFQTDLSECLGAKVLIKHTAQGRGSLVIHYNNLDELDGIMEHIS